MLFHQFKNAYQSSNQTRNWELSSWRVCRMQTEQTYRLEFLGSWLQLELNFTVLLSLPRTQHQKVWSVIVHFPHLIQFDQKMLIMTHFSACVTTFLWFMNLYLDTPKDRQSQRHISGNISLRFLNYSVVCTLEP